MVLLATRGFKAAERAGRRAHMEETIPLSRRPGDIALVVFFWVNILGITYVEGLEQLVIADPRAFEYPVWPPGFAVDLVHWWGRNFDPLLMARPTWWKAIIWTDVVFFGPFYACAIYAFTRGRAWIRIPSIIYASVLLTMVIVILGEEIFGPHATPRLGIVLLANGPWALFPIFLLYRMITRPRPFTRPAEVEAG
jgi:hypothetical protein